MPYVFQTWCRAVEILVSSSFFEQMTFEQMTHLHLFLVYFASSKHKFNTLSLLIISLILSFLSQKKLLFHFFFFRFVIYKNNCTDCLSIVPSPCFFFQCKTWNKYLSIINYRFILSLSTFCEVDCRRKREANATHSEGIWFYFPKKHFTEINWLGIE